MQEYEFTDIDPDDDPEESDWQLTPARKAAIEKALQHMKTILEQNPTFRQVSDAAEQIQIEVDTNRHQK